MTTSPGERLLEAVALPALASHPWAYPMLEVVHLWGIAALLGGLLVFDLGLWMRPPRLPVDALARLALPLALVGFGLVVASGLLMFASQPGVWLGQRLFAVKLGLVMLAGTNAALFHARGGVARADAWARGQSLVSVVLWSAVLVCGRFLAYR